MQLHVHPGRLTILAHTVVTELKQLKSSNLEVKAQSNGKVALRKLHSEKHDHRRNRTQAYRGSFLLKTFYGQG